MMPYFICCCYIHIGILRIRSFGIYVYVCDTVTRVSSAL